MDGTATPVVATSAGPVRGLVSGGVHTFLGIPFAADPSGANRFAPPLAPRPWSTPHDATRFGPAFAQLPQAPDYLACFGAQPIERMSEDALTLNVWSSSLEERLPVLVYIHGGGYFSGSGSELPVYDGTTLARTQRVVVVTFNYRLGALGFLHLGDIAGPRYATSGNAGLLDMLAALHWVRDNVASFGGDPGNVTVFGSSAGGHAVTVLTAMPMARGLFHRAVAQSGHALFCRSREAANTITEAYLEVLGVKPDDTERLHTMEVDELVAAQARLAFQLGGVPPTLLCGPVVDGAALPFSPVESPHLPTDVPLLIGSNGHEEECGGGVEQFANMWESAGAAPVYAYRSLGSPSLRRASPSLNTGWSCPLSSAIWTARSPAPDQVGELWRVSWVLSGQRLRGTAIQTIRDCRRGGPTGTTTLQR